MLCQIVPRKSVFKELGIDSVIGTFYSWVGPKGIPKDRINILYNGFKKAIESKEFKDFSDSQGVTISMKNPEELGKLYEKEDKMWKQLVEMGGIKPE